MAKTGGILLVFRMALMVGWYNNTQHLPSNDISSDRLAGVNVSGV